MADQNIRAKMAAAGKRIARLKRIDRAAVFIITLGGIAVVLGVLGILVFIGAEAIPLFKAAEVSPRPLVTLSSAVGPATPGLRAVGVDEYRKYLFTVEPDAVVRFHPLDPATPPQQFPFPGLAAGTRVIASSRSHLGNLLAAGTEDGRVAMAQVVYTPQYEQQKLSGLEVSVREQGIAEVDPARRAIRQVSYIEDEGKKFVAAIVGPEEIAVWQAEDPAAPRRAIVRVPAGQIVEHVRLGRHASIAAVTKAGRMYHWIYESEVESPRLTDDVLVANEPVTALEYLLGGSSVVVGTASGEITSWFRANMPDGTEALIKAHVFEPQRSAIAGFSPSPRDRTFAAVGVDGSLVLRHQTSERTLASIRDARATALVVIAPKADAIYTLDGSSARAFEMRNPHPEASVGALAGKVWYEGYAEPEYVWQSTGASDDFEPKLSLVPLVFGTIKGTVYAMLFAVPISVLAALYTSQFVHPNIKAKIKPTVEIMAALPSVVIGFLAGLYLAGVVERNLVAVFAMMALFPIFGTSGVVLWKMLPQRVSVRLRAGTEVLMILPLLLLAGWVAVQAGPWLEAVFFGGDARTWLHTSLGLTYDQRNCLVVGLAMGFAVIPIIFTIAEDAFTSVPSSLTAASLALGASRWQTAMRVVLPTGSPGVFSAIMIGFGRAVGETMIVLMATGNTPVMEWSIFNGIRTLSANIAVEIPEAPYGGTLYRTLFLAAALLFVMTFVINTIAEIIRQRLRERYKAV